MAALTLLFEICFPWLFETKEIVGPGATTLIKQVGRLLGMTETEIVDILNLLEKLQNMKTPGNQAKHLKLKLERIFVLRQYFKANDEIIYA